TRGKMFVRERLSQSVLDGDRIARAIELTRFPVPDDDDHADTNSEAGLVRAADLIGQLADTRYPQKLNALFHEFVETGTAKQLGLSSPADLVVTYPTFFWNSVEPHIGDALRYLSLTSEGRQWVANLNCHVFPTIGQLKLPRGDQDNQTSIMADSKMSAYGTKQTCSMR